MLMIRFQRLGKRKSPSYRLVVSDKAQDPQSGSLEIVGQYDPTKKPKIIVLKTERILYWIGKGAQPSASVNNLLIGQNVITGKKQKSVSITQKRAKKMADKKAKETV
jgi:small subunit ribosomal protein S16